MSAQLLRAKFTDGGLETASPARILVMAYDRLDRDLAGALIALESRDIERAHDLLVHAQDLVHELHCMLDVEVWQHAEQLASIYRYVIDLLIAANMAKRAKEVIEARTMLAGLGGAFRQAIASTAAPTGSIAPARSRFSSALAAPVTRPVPVLAGADTPARPFSARA